MFRDTELHIILSYNYVYTVSTNISTKFNRLYMIILKPCPAAGTFEMAAKPLGTSANFKPADGDK